MTEQNQNEESKDNKKEVENSLARRLSVRASRHLMNKNKEKVDTRLGVAFLGAIGWHLPVPTVLGILIGRWLDKKFPYEDISWTINFLILGLGLGLYNTWKWLKREGIEHAEQEQKKRDEMLAQMNAEIDAEKARYEEEKAKSKSYLDPDDE